MSSNGPVRLLLVGKSGVGKSATGNAILHWYSFKVDASGESVTRSTSTYHNTVCGRQVVVTDSPGLFDTTNDDEATKEVVKGLVATSPGPHAVLYVISTAGGRYDEHEYNAFLRAKGYLGEEVTNHMIIIFTHGDVLQKKKSLEKWLESASQYLQDVVQACGQRCVIFNNEAAPDENTKQVDQLFCQIDRLRRSHYTGSPYAGMAQAEIDKELAERRQQEDKREVESNPHGKKITQNLIQETKRRIVSEKERDDANTARIAAQNAEIAAQYAKLAAERARDEKEKERAAAKKQKIAAEEARAKEKNARIAAEKERDDEQNKRIAVERARDEAARDRKRNKAASIFGAFLSAGGAVGGVVLAPVTGGASLGLTVISTAALGVNVRNAVDNSD